MRKYYYRLNNDLNDAINEYKDLLKKSNNLKFVITLNDEDFLEDENSYKSILNILKQNNIEPHNIVVAIKPTKRNYEQEEWSKIVEISNKLTDKGIQFGFEDQDKIFNIQQIQNANDKIITTSNGINKLKLSPYEKLLMSYFTVTSRKYVSEDKLKDHPADSRSIYGVLNSKKIVCVGFSEWLKNILLELDDANIKVFSNEVSCSRDNKTINGYHENLIIYIKDEKYGIDGYYYLDPTWDCARDNNHFPTLSYFMVPLKDIEKIKFHIRSYNNSGLKPPPDTTSKQRTRKKVQNDYSIGREYKLPLSFSSDKFEFNKEFLRDLFNSNPQLFEKIKEKLYENKLLDLFKQEEELIQQRNLLEEMKQVVETTGIDVISEEEKFELRKIIDKCYESRNIDEFIKFEQRIKNNHLNKKQMDIEDFISCCKQFISKDHYIALIKQKIEDLESLNKESYEMNILEYINSYGNDANAQQLREEYIKEHPFSDYGNNSSIEKYKEKLKQLELDKNGIWKQSESDINRILKKLETKFIESPELTKYLNNISENDIQIIFDSAFFDCFTNLIYNSSEYSANQEDFQVGNIIFDMECRMKEATTQTKIIEDELRHHYNDEKIASIKSDIDNACSTDNMDLDIVMSRVINHDGCKQIIEEYLKENSEAIDLSILSRAMTQILQKNRNIATDQIYDYQKCIIDYNCNHILSKFDASAINSFVQYAITYNQEQ